MRGEFGIVRNIQRNKGILPRRTWCGEQFLDSYAFRRGAQVIECVIAIMD
jgi:hypothetical protein